MLCPGLPTVSVGRMLVDDTKNRVGAEALQGLPFESSPYGFQYWLERFRATGICESPLTPERALERNPQRHKLRLSKLRMFIVDSQLAGAILAGSLLFSA